MLQAKIVPKINQNCAREYCLQTKFSFMSKHESSQTSYAALHIYPNFGFCVADISFSTDCPNFPTVT